jgi:hypothetical protein
MDGTFEWEDEFRDLMADYQTELASIEAQEAAERAEARRRANGGVDLMPVFAQLESFMYRIAKLERENIDFAKRIAELEARQTPSNLVDAVKIKTWPE